MPERTYPHYEPDLSGAHPRDIGGAHRYVIVLGVRLLQPLIVHRSNGQAFHMTYATSLGAIKAQNNVRSTTTWGEEVRVYDKKLDGVR